MGKNRNNRKNKNKNPIPQYMSPKQQRRLDEERRQQLEAQEEASCQERTAPPEAVEAGENSPPIPDTPPGISQKQLEANRQNAQKSTGATTPEGQARSRMNALRWGFHAQADVLPWENPEDYKAHCISVLSRYNPQDDTELYLVRRIASAEWRLFRVDRVETMIYEACEGNALLLMAETTRLYQNENRLERVRSRALKELEEHRRSKAQGAANGGTGFQSREEAELMWAMITAEAGHSVSSSVVDKVIHQNTPPSSVVQGGNIAQRVKAAAPAEAVGPPTQ